MSIFILSHLSIARTRKKHRHLYFHNKHVFMFGMIFFILLQFEITASADSTTAYQLRSGAWAVSSFNGPFRSGWPVVGYLPPGTIVFEEEPGNFPSYKKVRTHFGDWLQIKDTFKNPRTGNVENIMFEITDIGPKPKDKRRFILLDSIFCLGETNLITEPPKNSCRHNIPVGKGWTFYFKDHPVKPESWFAVEAHLDETTKNEMKERGWAESESRFGLHKMDMAALEESGYLIRLDRDHPRYRFDYILDRPVFVECGRQEELVISQEQLESKAATVEAGLGGSLWGWISAKISGSVEFAERDEEARTIKFSQSTLNESYMYYFAEMRSQSDNAEYPDATIYIEKRFDCETEPKRETGNRITQIVFDIQFEDAVEAVPYTFRDPGKYLEMDSQIYNKHTGRPIFISANSQDQQEFAMKSIMETHGVNIYLAHFMYVNINNSCAGHVRERCKELVSIPKD